MALHRLKVAYGVAVLALCGGFTTTASASAPQPRVLAAMAARHVSKANGAAEAEFTIKASRGYSIWVSGSGHSVTLSAIGSEGFALYQAHGRVSRDGIRVRFGGLGRVAVRFRESRKVRHEKPPKGCAGKPRLTTFGAFLGTIRFRGEHGFTRLRARRAHGSVSTSPHWRCRSAADGTSPLPPLSKTGVYPAVLVARAPHIDFLAMGAEEPEGARAGFSLFIATSTERRGRLQIERMALTAGDPPTFTFDQALDLATLAPPPPFAGTATFQRNPDSSIGWSGDLRVSLPGARNIPLTGPGFTAALAKPKGQREFAELLGVKVTSR